MEELFTSLKNAIDVPVSDTFSKESVQELFNKNRSLIATAKRIKSLENINTSELYTELQELDKKCAAKEEKVDELKSEMIALNSELSSLSDEHNSLSLQEMELSKKIFTLEGSLKKLKNYQICKKDEHISSNFKTRAMTFKNVLGVKFDLTDTKVVLRGYVFNKKYVKWFMFTLGDKSLETIQKLLWAEILKGADTDGWPQLTLDFGER